MKPEKKTICEDEPAGVAIVIETMADGCCHLRQYDFGMKSNCSDTVAITDSEDARAIAAYLETWAQWKDQEKKEYKGPYFDEITQEEFSEILSEVISDNEPLDVPGAYEVFREHFNNQVLELWAERNPDKAYPNGWPEDEDAV
jgi:hypothetical protein